MWFNGRMWASQARDEGSIPFTRSIDNQRLTTKCRKSAGAFTHFYPWNMASTRSLLIAAVRLRPLFFVQVFHSDFRPAFVFGHRAKVPPTL